MAQEKSTGRRSDIRTKGRYDTLCPLSRPHAANSSFDWGQCDGLSLQTKKIKGLHKNELLR